MNSERGKKGKTTTAISTISQEINEQLKSQHEFLNLRLRDLESLQKSDVSMDEAFSASKLPRRTLNRRLRNKKF